MEKIENQKEKPAEENGEKKLPEARLCMDLYLITSLKK